MIDWFTCNLGDAMLASESIEHIRVLFLSEYEKANRPREMAAFIRLESEGHLHCEAKVYLSPAAIAVAKAVGAVSCRKPIPYGLGLLAGSEKSWLDFFPGNDD